MTHDGFHAPPTRSLSGEHQRRLVIGLCSKHRTTMRLSDFVRGIRALRLFLSGKSSVMSRVQYGTTLRPPNIISDVRGASRKSVEVCGVRNERWNAGYRVHSGVFDVGMVWKVKLRRGASLGRGITFMSRSAAQLLG